MRSIRTYLPFLVLHLLVASKCYSQDPQFSQVYAAPLYLNPAMCGDTYSNRVAMNWRNQWSSVNEAYKTYSASLDHRFRKNGAIGFSALRDEAGVQDMRFSDLALHYSHGVKTGRKSSLRFGMRLGYVTRDHNIDKLFFWDQVARGNAPQTIENALVDKVNYVDAGSGAVFFSQRFWFGASAAHLNRPVYSLLGSQLRMPVKYSIHFGGQFPLTHDKKSFRTPTLSPVVHFKWQQDWKQLDLGAYWARFPYMVGVWYRGIPVKKQPEFDYLGHDALVLLAGIEIDEKFRLGYSYDITLSRLAGRSGGSHEITLVYEWPFVQMKEKKKVVPCPKF